MSLETEQKPPQLIGVVGPTASGKTAVAVRLAEKTGGEIISADSMQIWRGLDIGTAKPTSEERERAVFHLVDVAGFDESFSAAQFQQRASEAVRDILGRGRPVILAGGTGLYAWSVVYEPEFPPATPPKVREQVREELAIEGAAAMHRKLGEVDPQTASRLAEADWVRVTRALEVFRATGRPMSSFRSKESREAASDSWLLFGLEISAEKLIGRINSRIDCMLEDGLVEEVRRLASSGLRRDMQSARALGYSEILAFLEGEMSLDEAIERIRVNTRRYAKRQRTWFRGDDSIRWIQAGERSPDDLAEEILIQAGIEA